MRHLFVATAAIIFSALLVSGCSPLSDPSPLTDQDRRLIRSAILSSAWEEVRTQYPEAIRPEVVRASTLSERDWTDELVQCLRDRGITARLSGGHVNYSSSNGQPPIEVAVSFYSCTMSHPSAVQVVRYLNGIQLNALNDYFVNSVRPCLIAALAPSPLPPVRSAVQTLSGVLAASNWNPYDAVWASDVSSAALGSLEHRCPPIPPWLNLGPG